MSPDNHAPQQPPVDQQPPMEQPPAVDMGGAPAPAPVATPAGYTPVTGQPMAPTGYPGQDGTPGKGLSIAGFILALLGLVTFGATSLIGLILSIIGRIQSKKGGKPSGLALAGIIISAISMVLGVVMFMLFFGFGITQYSQLNEKCKELGPGVHQVEWLGTDAKLTCDASSEYDDIE